MIDNNNNIIDFTANNNIIQFKFKQKIKGKQEMMAQKTLK